MPLHILLQLQISSNKQEQRMRVPSADLQSVLHQVGRRWTGQRQLVLEILQNHSGHLDADELFRLAQLRDPRISLSTIYRTLNILNDLGLIEEEHLGEEHHHYEAGSTEEHYHLICSACGEVIEFRSPFANILTATVAKEHDYDIEQMHIEISGYCARCRAKKTVAS
jgi:Fur family transcriptional regulator, ferric uptake regulator